MTTEELFIISICYERWTDDDKDAGEPGETGIEVDLETVDADDLKKYARNYGVSELSVNNPGNHIWFCSTFPREDREYFEQGIDKFYSMHIHKVNGRKPEAKDYQKIADMIGVKFDRRIELAEPVVNLDEIGDLSGKLRVSIDSVAEWVGLHCGRNFDAEPSKKRLEWIRRYADSMDNDPDEEYDLQSATRNRGSHSVR